MRPIYTCRICGLGTDGEAVHLNCAVAEGANDAAIARRNLVPLAEALPLLTLDIDAVPTRPERQPFTNS